MIDGNEKRDLFIFNSLTPIHMQAICMKCSRAAGIRQKVMREMTNPEYVTMKNGRRAVKGQCSACGTGMYKIVKKTEAAA